VASLYFRRGAWELRYREPSGKQRCERFAGGTTRRAPEEALDRHADVERDLRRNRYVPREAREARFEEYFERWWAARRVSRSRTCTDLGRARLHVLPHWGRWRLCDIRPSDVDDWIAGLSDRMGPISVRHCYTLFRGPIRRAVKDQILPDPLIDIALPPNAVPTRSPDLPLSGPRTWPAPAMNSTTLSATMATGCTTGSSLRKGRSAGLTSANRASDVVGLLQHVGVPQVDVFGLGVGGGVALHLAIKHPGTAPQADGFVGVVPSRG